MKFFLMIYRDDVANRVASVGKVLYLPKVLNSQCKHEINMTGAIPVEIPSYGVEVFKLKEAGDLASVNQEQWQSIEEALRAYLDSIGHGSLTAAPGMRFGPLDIRLFTKKREPELIEVTPYLLFSSKILETFRENGITGYEAYPATVEPGKLNVHLPNYYELVYPSVLPLSQSANYRETLCSICGRQTKIEYDSLIVDENYWSGADFVRTPGLRRELLSSNVKKIIEAAGVSQAKFIPSEMLSAGPNMRSITELMADLEFDRQRKERQRI